MLRIYPGYKFVRFGSPDRRVKRRLREVIPTRASDSPPSADR